MTTLRDIIAKRYSGILSAGAHSDGRLACALEAAHAAMGDLWSDAPDRWPDLRPMNDGPWSSDRARTEALVPTLEALWDWADWPLARQVAWAHTVVLRTVRELLPPALEAVGLHTEAAACAGATTIETVADAAYNAANAAYDTAFNAAAAAYSAADAAYSAALSASGARGASSAATHAARAAADAARAHGIDGNADCDAACTIWREAAAS